MTVLVVGSIALDTLETPFGRAEELLGGAGSYFSLAASVLTNVQMVGVIGADLPEEHLETLRSRGIDLGGVQRVQNGKTFRWTGRYEYDMNVAQTIDTQLNVFGDFRPNLPEKQHRRSRRRPRPESQPPHHAAESRRRRQYRSSKG